MALQLGLGAKEQLEVLVPAAESAEGAPIRSGTHGGSSQASVHPTALLLLWVLALRAFSRVAETPKPALRLCRSQETLPVSRLALGDAALPFPSSSGRS